MLFGCALCCCGTLGVVLLRGRARWGSDEMGRGGFFSNIVRWVLSDFWGYLSTVLFWDGCISMKLNSEEYLLDRIGKKDFVIQLVHV